MVDDVEDQADDVEPARRRPRLGVTVAAGLLLLAVGITYFVVDGQRTETRADTAEHTADVVLGKNQDVAAAAVPVCSQPQTDPQLIRLCAEVESAEDANPTPAERVDYQRVQQIVAAALEQDPTLTEPALLAKVRAVYKQNPPKNGKDGKDAVPPSLEELLALIRQVYTENPPAAGADGQNAHCFDVPDDPVCQPRQGAQGISVTGMRFERTDAGDCVLAELLHNPANDTDDVLRVPVPAGFCDQPPPDDPTPDPPTSTEAPGGGLLGG